MIDKITRSQFLRVFVGFFAAIWTVLTAYPVFSYLLSGARRKIDEGSQVTSLSLGKVDDFLLGSSKNFKFGSIPAILIRNETGEFFAYNAICTHLGCTVQYSDQKKKIWCACHGGQFDPATGKNVSGPPPKPLAALKVEQINGEIIVSKA
jgi:cytochrome b6-f complex iron-sulfur subunit